MSAYQFKGHKLDADDWRKLHLFWHQFSFDYIHQIFDDPKKSMWWVCIDERTNAFQKGIKALGLKELK